MNLDELAPPTGDAFKFEKIGDTVKGVLTYVPAKPEMRINKFNGTEEGVVRLVLDTGADNDGPRTIYPVVGSTMAQAIREAVQAAGAGRLEVGGTLAVQYSSDKDTGKPQPLKMYTAAYKPPVATASVDDLLG